MRKRLEVNLSSRLSVSSSGVSECFLHSTDHFYTRGDSVNFRYLLRVRKLPLSLRGLTGEHVFCIRVVDAWLICSGTSGTQKCSSAFNFHWAALSALLFSDLSPALVRRSMWRALLLASGEAPRPLCYRFSALAYCREAVASLLAGRWFR